MSEDPNQLNQEILAELRQIKTNNKRMLYIFAGIAVFTVINMIYRSSLSSSMMGSWEQVNTAMRQEDFFQAQYLAQALVARAPNYYYGHSYLGAIYLAMGKPKDAEAEYSKAYELFPTEDAAKDLAAVQKRLAMPPDFQLH